MSERELIRTVTKKGQVTIPVEIRRLLGIKSNDRVMFSMREGQVVISVAQETLESAFGAVAPLHHPEDFQQLRDQAIEEHVAGTLKEMESGHDVS